MACFTAARSGANSAIVEDTNTQRRWSGVRMEWLSGVLIGQLLNVAQSARYRKYCETSNFVVSRIVAAIATPITTVVGMTTSRNHAHPQVYRLLLEGINDAVEVGILAFLGNEVAG